MNPINIKRDTPAKWDLRLYIAGKTPRAVKAFDNLKRICEEHLAGSYRIEIIDLLESPMLAKGDQIVCFVQSAAKFGVRYATLGFNEAAKLDDGSMWPVAFAIKDLTPADETLIAQLVSKAVG